MERYLEAKKCLVGAKNMWPSITAVNGNAIYDFGYERGKIGGIPILYGLKKVPAPGIKRGTWRLYQYTPYCYHKIKRSLNKYIKPKYIKK